ncbi:MAG: hypothetical protein EXR98_02960 [Gemmataceae bacterium]|nr:hypothetical protein [Gemmataceae bacterium]
MKRSRFVLTGAAVVLASVALVSAAQDQGVPVPQVPGGVPQVPGGQPALLPPGLAGGSELLAPKGVEKLMLTKEQKADYDKLNQAYNTKYKELTTSNKPILSDPDPTKSNETPDARFKAFKEAIEASNKLRPDYLAKFEKLLTDDQKKTLDEVRRELPVGNFAPNLGGPPNFYFGQRSGQFLPADLQRQLKLSEEQVKKIDELQKDLESKMLNLLTDDQKKAFETLRKQGGPGVSLPPNPFGVPPQPPKLLEPGKLPNPGDLKKVPDPAELKKVPEPELKKGTN